MSIEEKVDAFGVKHLPNDRYVYDDLRELEQEIRTDQRKKDAEKASNRILKLKRKNLSSLAIVVVNAILEESIK